MYVLKSFQSKMWLCFLTFACLIVLVLFEGDVSANVSACSGTAGVATTIGFGNSSSDTLDIYWVNSACEEILYNSMAPGSSDYIQQTFANHVWRARYRATGNLAVELTAQSSPSGYSVGDPPFVATDKVFLPIVMKPIPTVTDIRMDMILQHGNDGNVTNRYWNNQYHAGEYLTIQATFDFVGTLPSNLCAGIGIANNGIDLSVGGYIPDCTLDEQGNSGVIINTFLYDSDEPTITTNQFSLMLYDTSGNTYLKKYFAFPNTWN